MQLRNRHKGSQEQGGDKLLYHVFSIQRLSCSYSLELPENYFFRAAHHGCQIEGTKYAKGVER